MHPKGAGGFQGANGGVFARVSAPAAQTPLASPCDTGARHATWVRNARRSRLAQSDPPRRPTGPGSGTPAPDRRRARQAVLVPVGAGHGLLVEWPSEIQSILCWRALEIHRFPGHAGWKAEHRRVGRPLARRSRRLVAKRGREGVDALPAPVEAAGSQARQPPCFFDNHPNNTPLGRWWHCDLSKKGRLAGAERPRPCRSGSLRAPAQTFQPRQAHRAGHRLGWRLGPAGAAARFCRAERHPHVWRHSVINRRAIGPAGPAERHKRAIAYGEHVFHSRRGTLSGSAWTEFRWQQPPQRKGPTRCGGGPRCSRVGSSGGRRSRLVALGQRHQRRSPQQPP